jgi:hypothetical protein
MRKLVSGTLALVFLLSLSCGKSTPRYEGPHLAFDIAKVDFGTMDQMGEQTKEVSFKNQGNQVLEIKEVKTSCGCTAALPSDRVIDPGETGILKVTFKSGKSIGDIEKVITVLTNDPTLPETKLPVVAYVKTDITMSPRTLDFGEVKLGQEAFAEAKLVSETGSPFEITFVEADTASFTYTLTPFEEAGKPGYTVKVGLKVMKRPQSFYKRIVLRTDNTRCPLFHLPVVANVLGNMKVEPKAIMLQGATGTGEQVRKVSVTALEGASVHLLGVETTKGIVEVETRTLEDGKNYEVEVTYDPKESGRNRDYLVLRTDDEYESEVRIPINIFFSDRTAKGVPPKGAGHLELHDSSSAGPGTAAEWKEGAEGVTLESIWGEPAETGDSEAGAGAKAGEGSEAGGEPQ